MIWTAVKTLSCLDSCVIFKICPKRMCYGFGKDFNLFEISSCSKKSHNNENGWCRWNYYYEGIEAIKPIIPSELLQNPVKIVEFLACNNRSKAFPNLFIALRILLTNLVTGVSEERQFSKLRFNNTFLRSTMSQEHLNSLCIMSIECEVGREMSLDEIWNIIFVHVRCISADINKIQSFKIHFP